MLITQSDDGYIGLRQSLTGVFDKAVCSPFNNVSDEHGFTEDGKSVSPFNHHSSVRERFRPTDLAGQNPGSDASGGRLSPFHPAAPAPLQDENEPQGNRDVAQARFETRPERLTNR